MRGIWSQRFSPDTYLRPKKSSRFLSSGCSLHASKTARKEGKVKCEDHLSLHMGTKSRGILMFNHRKTKKARHLTLSTLYRMRGRDRYHALPLVANWRSRSTIRRCVSVLKHKIRFFLKNVAVYFSCSAFDAFSPLMVDTIRSSKTLNYEFGMLFSTISVSFSRRVEEQSC